MERAFAWHCIDFTLSMHARWQRIFATASSLRILGNAERLAEALQRSLSPSPPSPEPLDSSSPSSASKAAVCDDSSRNTNTTVRAREAKVPIVDVTVYLVVAFEFWVFIQKQFERTFMFSPLAHVRRTAPPTYYTACCAWHIDFN